MVVLLVNEGALSACLLLLFCHCCAEGGEVPHGSTAAATDSATDSATDTATDSAKDGLLSHMHAVLDGSARAVSAQVVAAIGDRFSETQTQCAAQTAQLEGQLSAAEAGLRAELSSAEAGLRAELSSAETGLRAELSSAMVGLRAALSTAETGLRAELSEHTAKLIQHHDAIGREMMTLQRATLDLVRIKQTQILRQVSALVTPPPRDCSDLPAGSPSGIHLLHPGLRDPVPALCDQDTDGGNWTIIQRRADIKPRQDFYLGWQEYKWGFGRLDGEFWWGLERLWLATSLLDRQYELRVDLEDFDGERRHAVFQGFRISPEADNYRLTVANYTGDAGDSLTGHSGHPFSTKDRDNDTYGTSCAQSFHGAWWYTACHGSNLNGNYLAGQHDSYADGVNWSGWRGYHYSLKTVTMMMRPTNRL